jgi:hypothetical protein
MSTSGVRAGDCSSLALVTHGEGPIGIQSFCQDVGSQPSTRAPRGRPRGLDLLLG